MNQLHVPAIGPGDKMYVASTEEGNFRFDADGDLPVKIIRAGGETVYAAITTAWIHELPEDEKLEVLDHLQDLFKEIPDE